MFENLEQIKQKLNTVSAQNKIWHNCFMLSAVVLPLVKIEGKMHLLFEVRAKSLKWQPNEVCFPGGKIDKTDISPWQAAIREIKEELFLKSDKIKLLGALPLSVYPVGVMIYPFLAVIENIEELSFSKDEVEEIFFVPCDFFMKNQPLQSQGQLGVKLGTGYAIELLPKNFERDWRTCREYDLYFYQYEKYLIWGITADLIRKLFLLFKE